MNIGIRLQWINFSTSNEGAGLLATLGFKGGFPVVEDKDGYSGSSAKLITLYTKGAGFGLAPAITSALYLLVVLRPMHQIS